MYCPCLDPQGYEQRANWEEPELREESSHLWFHLPKKLYGKMINYFNDHILWLPYGQLNFFGYTYKTASSEMIVVFE